MTSKRILKMNMPEVNLYIVIVGIASIFLLYYNFYLGGLFFIGFLYMVINNWKTTNIRRKEWNNYIQNLSLDIDETTKRKSIINKFRLLRNSLAHGNILPKSTFTYYMYDIDDKTKEKIFLGDVSVVDMYQLCELTENFIVSKLVERVQNIDNIKNQIEFD